MCECTNVGVYKTMCAYECVWMCGCMMYERRDVGIYKCVNVAMYERIIVGIYECSDV